MKEISAVNFFNYYQTHNSYRIIDVREPYEFDKFHIAGSMNIPLNLLLDKHFLFINKKHHYFVICKNGTRSKTACTFLSQVGYNVTNVIDGIEKWPGRIIRPNYLHTI